MEYTFSDLLNVGNEFPTRWATIRLLKVIMKRAPIAPDSPLDTTVNKFGVLTTPLDKPGPNARIFDCRYGPTTICY